MLIRPDGRHFVFFRSCRAEAYGSLVHAMAAGITADPAAVLPRHLAPLLIRTGLRAVPEQRPSAGNAAESHADSIEKCLRTSVSMPIPATTWPTSGLYFYFFGATPGPEERRPLPYRVLLDDSGARGELDWPRCAIDPVSVRAVKGGT